MSYYQDGGGIIHLPASTHAAYSHGQPHRQQQPGIHGLLRNMNYGTTTTTIANTITAPNTNVSTTVIMPISSSATDSGNISLDSHQSLMEAGELLLAAPSVPNSSSNLHRRKPDITIVMSLLSFFIWLRLLQTMFYQSTLGHLEGFVKELLCAMLVWIPSITLTCFYFRSDDHHGSAQQSQLQRRYFRQSWGR